MYSVKFFRHYFKFQTDFIYFENYYVLLLFNVYHQQSQSSSQRGRGCQRPISSQPSQQNRSNGTHASQQSQTQDSSDYDVERMVTEVIQYLLISERKRLPVKKADITKHLALKGNTAKIFKTVMVAAGKFLEDVRIGNI